MESDQFAGNRIFSVSSGFYGGIGIWKFHEKRQFHLYHSWGLDIFVRLLGSVGMNHMKDKESKAKNGERSDHRGDDIHCASK